MFRGIQSSRLVNRKVSPLSIPLILPGIKSVTRKNRYKNCHLTRQNGASIISRQRKIFQPITMIYLFRARARGRRDRRAYHELQSTTKRKKETLQDVPFPFFYSLFFWRVFVFIVASHVPSKRVLVSSDFVITKGK